MYFVVGSVQWKCCPRSTVTAVANLVNVKLVLQCIRSFEFGEDFAAAWLHQENVKFLYVSSSYSENETE
jgi:hypothetical protein